MAGTKEGARKAVATNLSKNPNHYSEMGSKGEKGGANSTGSFNAKTGSAAGKKGGARGRRTKLTSTPEKPSRHKPRKVTELTLENYPLQYEELPDKRRPTK